MAHRDLTPNETVLRARCDCGRYAGWDGYYARWWCDRCERVAKLPPKDLWPTRRVSA